ncbi:hypothetical protein Agub_g12366 [Astrephomene gubernaculifera]|uniref:Uncharacterized protein n=1 Tax=Astrephomene gubernaculifera TaxID=47775 RepID=A0AAD3E0V4_9CHLO|nr:hypothetical protein Agub_g12366 [Astrephomene gubernaculifera]
MSNKEKGGAEAYARFKQFDYKANSSLVLTSDTRTREYATEPSGEPETLWGRMKGKMGDRAQTTKPDAERKEKAAKKKRDAAAAELELAVPTSKGGGRGARRGGGGGAGGMSVLDLEQGGLYRPRTKETREAYEALLAVIHSLFGEQPQDVLRGAADEVLAVLKRADLRDPERQRECGQLLGGCEDDMFARLVALGKRITDYVTEAEAAPGDTMDEELGVAVEFEEEEDEEEEEADEVLDVDEDDEGDEQQRQEADLRTTTMDDVDAGEEARDEGLKVQEVDAYWLQRRIARALGPSVEATRAQALAEQVLSVLGGPDDQRAVENELVLSLGFEHFELIKELIRNRLKIVWCTRLSRAETDEERGRIEAEMGGSPDTGAILAALRATRTSARDRQSAMERSIREEARKLRQGEAGVRGEGGAGGVSAGRHQVALDSLAFRQGAHLMSNKSVALPQGSQRRAYKGYEEVEVPALKPKPFGEGEKLKKISELPEWSRGAFAGMEQLNRIQSRVADCALFSGENMLVCAPTGAGKTNVAMLCVMHELGLHLRPDGTIDTSAFKIVYVAPMKALVAEMVGNFSKRLTEAYGIKVRELTGDINLSKAEIEETQIIVTTPEKWDIITRKSDDRTYANLVRLLIIDEIHLLHDDRGPVLESIIARTIRQVESTQEMTRIVGLSATLPNYEDVAVFLRVKPDKGLFYFDNSYRPCPLAQQYIGVSVKKPLQRFQLMNEICYNKVLECAGRHQVLVFVHSRKETAKTARYVKETALAADVLTRFMRSDSASREILQTEAENCKDSDLRDLLPFGFAIHHAGMSRADRTLVEDLFADGHVQVLVSTATLAWGVNLPAHTVVIKGTQIYNPVKGAWDELSPQDVMQMMGRAGRPQFDSFGEGIIITGHSELQFYLSLFNQQLPIESQFVKALADNMNAEVVLGTVSNLKDAAHWLGYTYLYVRMLRSPALYGVPPADLDTDPLLQDRRLDLAHSAALLLDKHGLVRYDRKTGNFQTTDLGRIASHYYVSYTTIAHFNEHLKPTMTDIELMRLFSLAEEFRYMVVREEEKLELAKLVERVPIPVKESLDEPTAKVNVLLQAYISNLKLEGLALSSDMVYVTQSAGRLMRCLFEICLRRGWAGLTDRALALSKMVTYRMWGSQSPLRQFKGVPNDVLVKLEKRDLPWERFYDLTSQELGELIRAPKMGKSLHKLIHQFPRLELSAHVQPITRTCLKVDLTITPDFAWEDKVHGWVEPFWIFVEDQDSEQLLHTQYWLLKRSNAGEEHTVAFTVPVCEPLPPQYFVRVVSDRWLGCEATLPISFRHLILPTKFPPPTELLDLQPLPVSALRNAAFEALYQGLSHFNPIQTQVFTALYNSDDNALIAAPTGSGKTICAEFAILRMLARAAEGKCTARCVYIAPHESLAQDVAAAWGTKFGEGLGVSVTQLTGETAADLKLLERGNIVVATPAQWDVMSRRWKQRRNVKDVALLILDELHLIGGPKGPTLEVVASRMRYISSQADKPIRIVGLCHSAANAKDLGDWIGATAHGLFNFPPGSRPVPLEVHVQGFDITNFEARMQAMSRPTYSALCAHAAGQQPALVFVPTRKHARLAALDLLTYAAADGEPLKFCGASEADLAPYLPRVRDAALRHSLQYGVGFCHETLAPGDQQAVRLLFESGAIQVLVVTAALCWGLGSLCSHLVVVAGTQYYDGSGLGASDYPITDLLQMIGRASRPMVDSCGKVVLMCASHRKEYYKRFLLEPLPVESHLDHYLHDHFVAEIVTKTIENKQDAVDYLTWSFYYRRLAQNPNYYNMGGVSHRHLSDHLSELVENTLADLETSKVISIEDDMDLSPLNLGMIAAYYHISYTTIELFAASLAAKTKTKGLLEILANASEFSSLEVRPGEENAITKLLTHAPVAVSQLRPSDPHCKAHALLQAHFSRLPLGGDLALDQREVVREAVKLLQAIVDVIASNGWLSPALAAMEMSQMVTQALWDKDSPLLQLPHVTPDTAARLEGAGCSSVFELLEMEEGARREALAPAGLTEAQMGELAAVANRYPDINVSYEVVGGEESEVLPGEAVSVVVSLEREVDEEAEGEVPGPVPAPHFPGRRDEGWWLVVGDSRANSLLAIKRVNLGKAARTKLEFAAPPPGPDGSAHLTLYFMCDSWLGCDQEYEINLKVAPNEDAMEQ